jgi:hypothetical protein
VFSATSVLEPQHSGAEPQPNPDSKFKIQDFLYRRRWVWQER